MREYRWLSQTVLLSGVNDNGTMMRLCHGLSGCASDLTIFTSAIPSSGSAHFRAPVEKGMDIIEGLQGHTAGYAIPST